MTLLTSEQRAIFAADTQIDRLIIDRATEAFDALIDRGDVERYKLLMATAYAQMGFQGPVRPQDRPTALDKTKTLLIRAYSDREHIPFKRAAQRLRKMLEGG